MSEFKILAHDKIQPGCCSRCGFPLDPLSRVVIAEWNGLKFEYCPECQEGGRG